MQIKIRMLLQNLLDTFYSYDWSTKNHLEMWMAWKTKEGGSLRKKSIDLKIKPTFCSNESKENTLK